MTTKKTKSPIAKHVRKPKNLYEEKRHLRKEIHEKVKIMKRMNVTIAQVAVNRIIDGQKGTASDEVLEAIRKQTLESGIAKEMVSELNGVVDKIIKDVDEGWVALNHIVYVKCRLDALMEEMKNKL